MRTEGHDEANSHFSQFGKAPDSYLPKGRQAFGFYSGDGVYCEEGIGLLRII